MEPKRAVEEMWVVVVIELSTGEVVKTFSPSSKRTAEKVMSGVTRNLDGRYMANMKLHEEQ